MAIGSDITATRYNTLRARIDNIFGKGTGQNGYGQALESYAVNTNPSSADATVLAIHINKLYTDMVKARTHQTGVVPTSISQVTANESIVGEFAGSYVTDSLDSLTKLSEGYADFEALATIIENNADTVHSSQLTFPEAAITSQRTTSWNSTITHIFTVTFSAQTLTNTIGTVTSLTAEDHARSYFNAGGEIWFRASRTGGTASLKNSVWSTILTNAGTIKFRKLDTTTTGASTQVSFAGQSLGFFDLTTSYQTVAIKNGAGQYTEYSQIEYKIEAKRNAAFNQLTFRVSFIDDDTNSLVDENIDGTITSYVELSRPTGPNVSVAKPIFANTSNL